MNVAVPPAAVVLPDGGPRSSPPSSSVACTVASTAASVVGYNRVSPLPLTRCASVTVSLVVFASFRAVAVTVCAVCHVVAVNVNAAGAASTAAVALLVTPAVTAPLGGAFKLTVYSVPATRPVSFRVFGSIFRYPLTGVEIGEARRGNAPLPPVRQATTMSVASTTDALSPVRSKSSALRSCSPVNSTSKSSPASMSPSLFTSTWTSVLSFPVPARSNC